MSATDLYRKAKAVFMEAHVRADEERGAFLDAACEGDAALRDEVESLLAHAGPGVESEAGCGDHGRGIDAAGFAPARHRSVPERIGDYEVQGVIDTGGMGTVYLAEQAHPRRQVALKVMARGVASRAALRRFEYESQILARLQHRNIAQVYESGTHDDGEGGVPFFAMEYIHGARPLTDFAREENLGTRERLALFARVCDAVHHGHQKGIIHRDLKPGNILVDADGEPKIIDFGVARATDSDMAVTTIRTEVGQILGTLQYMSPEQIEADPANIDTRSDVYALGVVLYELLTEQAPYDVSRVPILEAARVIKETDPARPSSMFRTLRGDVETIVLKALEKDREQRYASAHDLGADIRRYLADQPILARPPSMLYHVRKFARRKRAAFIALVSIASVLIVASIVSSALAAAATRRATEAEWQSYLANVAAANAALDSKDLPTMRRRLAAAPAHLRGWEWRYLLRQSRMNLLTLRGHEGWLEAVAFSPDGTRVASGSIDGTVRLWDAATGEELLTVRAHEDWVRAVAFSPDGTRLATASDDNTIRVWDAATGDEGRTIGPVGERVGEMPHLDDLQGWVLSVAFSPDGTRLASGSNDATVRVWDATTGEQVLTLRGHEGTVWSVAFSPDGTRLASGSVDHTVRLWDAATGAQLHTLRGHDRLVDAVAFAPDGTRVASSSGDNTVRIWDTATGEPVLTLRGHESRVKSVAFSPDGTRLASGSYDSTIRLWDAATGEHLLTLHGHDHRVQSVAFSPDSGRLASGSYDYTIRIWDVAPEDAVLTLRGHEDRVSFLAFSPDSRRLVSTSRDRTVSLWDATTGETVLSFGGSPGRLLEQPVAFSPDGTRLAAGSTDNTVKVRDAATGEPVRILRGHEDVVVSVAFSPDGTQLASGSRDETIRLWNVATGEAVRTLRGERGEVWSLAFSPDGTRLASASYSGTIGLWDAATGMELRTLRGHENIIFDVAFSPDGTRLASGSEDGTIRLWDAATGEELRTLRGHRGPVWSVAFSPDGSRLASGAGDGTIRLWVAATGREVLTLRRDKGEVTSVTFSPNGSRIASGSKNGAIRIRDASIEEADVAELDADARGTPGWRRNSTPPSIDP